MFSTRNEYDRGVNTFSPEGRLLQVEYAIQAVKNGSASVGIKVKEGVVLAVERRLTSTLIEPSSIEKIFELDSHIGCAVSGLVNDAKTLVEHARVEAQNHTFVYDEPITVHALTQSLSDLALQFGESEAHSKKKPMARPFGVALLIAGVDRHGPVLYQTDPSGTMIRYEAKGMGSAQEAIESILQEQYKKDMSLVDAEKLAISILKQVMEEKITKSNVELVSISTATRKYSTKGEDFIADIIKKL